MSSPGSNDTDPERPRWSFTWMLRIQRVGRNRRLEGDGSKEPVFRWWATLIVVLLLIVETATLVWLGVLPR